MTNPRIKKVLITREEIEAKCVELANWVNETYKDSDDLLLIGLLKGSVPFLAQLIKDVTVDHALDFMTVSSFGGGTVSTGNLKIVMDLKNDIFNKDVLLVEDIVDSGLTLSTIVANLQQRKPRSLKVITLLDKPSGRKVNFEADKTGFVVPHEFLVGFGLDLKEKLRNLPYIGIFDETKLDEVK